MMFTHKSVAILVQYFKLLVSCGLLLFALMPSLLFRLLIIAHHLLVQEVCDSIGRDGVAYMCKPEAPRENLGYGPTLLGPGLPVRSGVSFSSVSRRHAGSRQPPNPLRRIYQNLMSGGPSGSSFRETHQSMWGRSP